MSTLTGRQMVVLKSVRSYIEENGFPPAMLDIASELGINVNAVQDHLRAIEKKGFITRVPSVSRGLGITEKGKKALKESK